MTHFKAHRLAFALFALLLTFCPPVFADDVTDAINEALNSYNSGEHSNAVQSLNYASQLILQKKGEKLEALLPQPLSGWEVENSTSQAMNTGMMGGGITAERQYRKADSSVTLQMVTDSPLLQSMMMMFANPMFATSDGGKLEKIAGQKAIVKYDADAKEGEIQIVVNNRFLITINGYDVSKNDLTAYAQAIDYNKLSALP